MGKIVGMGCDGVNCLESPIGGRGLSETGECWVGQGSERGAGRKKKEKKNSDRDCT